LAAYHVAGAQAEAPDLRLGDVDIVLAGEVMVRPQKADPFVDDLEDAAAQFQSLAFGIRLQKAQNKVFLFHSGAAGNFEFLGHAAQIDEGSFFKFGYVHG
jgi:hypothetical protein